MNTFFYQLSLISGLGLLVQALSGPLVAAPLFRWTDEEGTVHYSYTIPPNAQRLGHTELDKNGMPIKRVDPAKSSEQLAEEKRQRKLEVLRRQLEERQHKEDQRLLSAYSTLDQLDSFYQGRLKLLLETQSQLLLLKSKIEKEFKSLQDQYAAAKEEAHRKTLEGFIKTKHQDIADYDKALEQNQQEKLALQAEFDKQRERFRDLLQRREERLAKERAAEEAAKKALLDQENDLSLDELANDPKNASLLPSLKDLKSTGAVQSILPKRTEPD